MLKNLYAGNEHRTTVLLFTKKSNKLVVFVVFE